MNYEIIKQLDITNKKNKKIMKILGYMFVGFLSNAISF